MSSYHQYSYSGSTYPAPTYGGSADRGSYTPPSTYDDFNNYAAPSFGAANRYSSSKSIADSARELVAVPVLGGEWDPEEDRREGVTKRESRQKAAKEWGSSSWRSTKENIGKMGKVGKSKVFLFTAFAFIVALGLTLYFVIPRAPGVAWDKLTAAENSNPTTSSRDGSFSFAGDLALDFDASSTYVPLHFSQLTATVNDLNTGIKIGQGSLINYKIAARDISTITIPIAFSGQFRNGTDPTYLDVAGACGPIYPNVPRNSLSLSVSVEMKITGLIGSSWASTQVSDVSCPIAFPSNSS